MHTSADTSPRFPWLEQLLQYDTTSALSNLDLIGDVRDYLQGQGLQPFLTYNAERTKANLFATIPAQDGSTEGGLVLSGHTDVVPTTGQAWTVDPYKATYQNGRVYGRGSCDMKGFVAMALESVPAMLQARLRQPLHLCFSYDEEIGCAGISGMLEELQRRKLRPSACIVGEPTSMQVVLGHKGIYTYRCEIKGRSAHSSLQNAGVNAIEYAARLIERIRLRVKEYAASGPHDQAYEVAHLTAQTGWIEGGIAVNTIPSECSFLFEFRTLPGIDPGEFFAPIQQLAEELTAEMKSLAPETGIRFARISGAPPLETPSTDPIATFCREYVQDFSTHKVSYGTEAGLFQQAGISTVVYGPGAIAQAHKPDEYVSIADLLQCREALKAVIADYSRAL